jgi:hypothetical protein
MQRMTWTPKIPSRGHRSSLEAAARNDARGSRTVHTFAVAVAAVAGTALLLAATGLLAAPAASPPAGSANPAAPAITAASAGTAPANPSAASSAKPVATTEAAPAIPDAKTLARLSARLIPVPLAVDLSGLPANEQAALAEIVRAAQLMDVLFFRQVWAGSETRLLDLVRDASPPGKARLHAYLQNKGPWLRLDEDRPFLPDVGPKPPAGTFYAPGATKAEITSWLGTLAPDARKTAEGFFTTIRRAPDGRLQAIPYSVEYQPELAHVAERLRAAAALTTQPTLKAYLDARAAALLSNDYHASDVAWMKLDSSIEPTIGPYEVYEDGWFSAKAAFEAFVTIRDDAETAKLARFSSELQDIENHLPIPANLRNPKIGALAPIRVVNSIFSAGDANRGVQTAAFNLPNDERITKELGAKRTMLKNIQEAKFKAVLLPISRIVLAPADRKHVSFDAFFTHILAHELMHGLGPHEATVAGKRGTLRAALQEHHSALEEAKADISGLFALQFLIDKGVVDRGLETSLYTTFLASTFRSLRFGLHEAHGKGIALQLNTLLDAGAVRVASDGTVSIDPTRIKAAVAMLTTEIMTLQASGDRARAGELLRTRAVIRPEVRRLLDRLDKVPVDIEPRFVTAERLLSGR